MKKKNIYILVLLVFSLLFSHNVKAEEGFRFGYEAYNLNNMGLYNGISTENFEPDLRSTVNRETAIVMVMRIFGLEDDAISLDAQEAEKYLDFYVDKHEVSVWAYKHMAFAVKNGTIKGTSLNTLSPKTEIDGKMFASIILRLLGEVTPADSYQKGIDILSDKGIVSRKDVDYFKKCPFTKDQIVGMTYSALFAPFSNSNETLLDKLVHEGIIPTEDVILKRKVKQIIQEIITPNMTILEKEYAIYNYVINNVMYDYSFKKNTDYHALVEGVSVCQGYALATKLLFDEAGFESRVIFSTDHAWNLVKIGDSYYHLDSTGRKFNKNDDYVGSY